VPDAATIEARMAEATGPVDANYRDIISGTGTDGQTLLSEYVRGKDNLYAFSHGPLHTAYGSLHGNDWTQDANGITYADDPDPGLVPPLKQTTTVRHVTAPLDALVISTLDTSGFGRREYVDPATYLLLQRDDIDATATTTTTYSDYARFGTQMLPTSWHVVDHADGWNMTYTRLQFVAGKTNDTDVAEPGVRQIVTFPAGADRVDLHASIDSDYAITIPVTIGGRQIYFLLDSGSSDITIDPAVATQLGLTNFNPSDMTAKGRSKADATIVPSLNAGGVTLHDVNTQIMKFGSGRTPADPAGLLGFDFFSELIVHVDYEHKVVTVSDPRSSQAPSVPGTYPMPIRLRIRVPQVSANMGGAVAERLIVDTGSNGTVLIFPYFSRRHSGIVVDKHDNDLTSIDTPFDGGRPDNMAYGAYGEFKVHQVALSQFKLAAWSLNGLLVDVVDTKGFYEWGTDGLLGTAMLKFFNIDFDYADGFIYVIPNRNAK
jgi:predicted aspartyl protease